MENEGKEGTLENSTSMKMGLCHNFKSRGEWLVDEVMGIPLGATPPMNCRFTSCGEGSYSPLSPFLSFSKLLSKNFCGRFYEIYFGLDLYPIL
jgi:hypothetical protein